MQEGSEQQAGRPGPAHIHGCTSSTRVRGRGGGSLSVVSQSLLTLSLSVPGTSGESRERVCILNDEVPRFTERSAWANILGTDPNPELRSRIASEPCAKSYQHLAFSPMSFGTCLNCRWTRNVLHTGTCTPGARRMVACMQIYIRISYMS